jgi:hypothetical protein
MKFCLRCHDTRFVCEAHPLRPWIDSPAGCRCGAPGDPCPVCRPDFGEPAAPLDPVEQAEVEAALARLQSPWRMH